MCHHQLQLLTKRVRTEKAQRNNKVARLSTLKSVPRVGSIYLVDSAELWWTHDKIQRLFTCGRRLEDVVTDLHRGILLPVELRMIQIVHWESKWYSSSNQRLKCSQEAAVIAVQVRLGSIDHAFLHGLTARLVCAARSLKTAQTCTTTIVREGWTCWATSPGFEEESGLRESSSADVIFVAS